MSDIAVEESLMEFKDQVLEGQIGFLCEELGDPGRYFPQLRAKGVLQASDCQAIRSKSDVRERIQDFVSKLIGKHSSKGEHAFDVLVDALKKQRVQAHIARNLQKALAKAKENFSDDGSTKFSKMAAMPPFQHAEAVTGILQERVAYDSHPDHGPLPHPDHGPLPHPDYGPLPHPDYGPLPHPDYGPLPHPDHGPLPHPDHGPLPHPDHGPLPHPDHGLLPTPPSCSRLIISTNCGSCTEDRHHLSGVLPPQAVRMLSSNSSVFESSSESELGGQSMPNSEFTTMSSDTVTATQPNSMSGCMSSAEEESVAITKLQARIENLKAELKEAHGIIKKKDAVISTLKKKLDTQESNSSDGGEMTQRHRFSNHALQGPDLHLHSSLSHTTYRTRSDFSPHRSTGVGFQDEIGPHGRKDTYNNIINFSRNEPQNTSISTV